jgi:hypothetical protein
LWATHLVEEEGLVVEGVMGRGVEECLGRLHHADPLGQVPVGREGVRQEGVQDVRPRHHVAVQQQNVLARRGVLEQGVVQVARLRKGAG